MSQTDDLEIQSLAVQERFLEEWSAGKRPRLGDYVRRYPAHAAALTELVATLPLDHEASPAAETEGSLGVEQRLWLEFGVRRALDTIFGAQRAATAANDAQSLRVAEDSASYSTRQPPDEAPEPDGE